MLEAGVPIESIAKMMGHSSISSTQIYAQVTDQKIAKDCNGYGQIDKKTAVKDFLILTRKIVIDNNIVNDPFCKGPLTIPSLGDLCTEVSVSFEKLLKAVFGIHIRVRLSMI